jgi:phage gp45-like
MSRTDDTTRDTRDATSAEARGIAGMIRRMSIKLTSAPFWRTVGHLLLDGSDPETRDPEMFSGIGFYSRPSAGANAEAIVTFPGGASNPVIIAARDEDARKKHADLAQNETAMFNRLVIAVIKANGTMEIRTAAGVAQPTVLGTTYRSAEDVMLTAVSSAIALIASIPGLTAPQIAVVTAATTAITTFETAAASYLTAVLKAQ